MLLSSFFCILFCFLSNWKLKSEQIPGINNDVNIVVVCGLTEETAVAAVRTVGNSSILRVVVVKFICHMINFRDSFTGYSPAKLINDLPAFWFCNV